jgi:hypothetical protein
VSIYRVFFLNAAGEIYGGTGYDGTGQTGLEAAASMAIINEVPIEYTHRVQAVLQADVGDHFGYGSPGIPPRQVGDVGMVIGNQGTLRFK